MDINYSLTFPECVDGTANAHGDRRVGVGPDDPGGQNDVLQDLLERLHCNSRHDGHKKLRIDRQVSELNKASIFFDINNCNF